MVESEEVTSKVNRGARHEQYAAYHGRQSTQSDEAGTLLGLYLLLLSTSLTA
jgi:hypothetical protein